MSTGLLPANVAARGLLRHVNLERGLIAGGLVMSLGLGLCFLPSGPWWGFLVLAVGVQTLFGSFLLAMLRTSVAPR